MANDNHSLIQEFCTRNNIKVHNRASFDPANSEATFSFAISWKWMLDLSNLIVFHDSLLPKYRGFAPLVAQLSEGEKEIGVTALLPSETSYDCGDIIAQRSTSIDYPITIEQAIYQVEGCYLELIDFICNNHLNGKQLVATKQLESNASYSLWRDSSDYFINWSNDACFIERFVNAVGYPYGCARSYVDNDVVIIKEGVAMPDLKVVNRDCGKIIMKDASNHPIVVCGSGLFKITKALMSDGSESLEIFKRFRLRFR